MCSLTASPHSLHSASRRLEVLRRPMVDPNYFKSFRRVNPRRVSGVELLKSRDATVARIDKQRKVLAGLILENLRVSQNYIDHMICTLEEEGFSASDLESTLFRPMYHQLTASVVDFYNLCYHNRFHPRFKEDRSDAATSPAAPGFSYHLTATYGPCKDFDFTLNLPPTVPNTPEATPPASPRGDDYDTLPLVLPPSPKKLACDETLPFNSSSCSSEHEDV